MAISPFSLHILFLISFDTCVENYSLSLKIMHFHKRAHILNSAVLRMHQPCKLMRVLNDLLPRLMNPDVCILNLCHSQIWKQLLPSSDHRGDDDILDKQTWGDGFTTIPAPRKVKDFIIQTWESNMPTSCLRLWCLDLFESSQKGCCHPTACLY